MKEVGWRNSAHFAQVFWVLAKIALLTRNPSMVSHVQTPLHSANFVLFDRALTWQI